MVIIFRINNNILWWVRGKDAWLLLFSLFRYVIIITTQRSRCMYHSVISSAIKFPHFIWKFKNKFCIHCIKKYKILIDVRASFIAYP